MAKPAFDHRSQAGSSSVTATMTFAMHVIPTPQITAPLKIAKAAPGRTQSPPLTHMLALIPTNNIRRLDARRYAFVIHADGRRKAKRKESYPAQH
jgi:hypothetical protein